MKIERSDCGSGGCVTCPFSYNDEADQAQNYGCLPTRQDIIELKEKSGHNWACHYDETVLCGGFARYLMEKRQDLNVKEGGLISYEDWSQEGEIVAIVKASDRQRKKLELELAQVKAAYEDRLGDIEHLEKKVEDAIQIFKDIKIHGSWSNWNKHGINEKIDIFIKGQEMVN